MRLVFNPLSGKFDYIEDDAANITMARVAGSTYSTVQHLQDVLHSAGWTSGGTINDNGSATITVDAGTGLIRTSNSQVAEVQFFDWSNLTSTAIPTDTVRYVGVEWNAGSPQVVVRTSYNWNFNTDFPLGNVVNTSDVLHIENSPHAVGDHANFMIQRLRQTMPYKRDEVTGGLILGELGTRNVSVSAGAVWQGLTRFPMSAIDTSGVDTFSTWYYNGAAWVETTGVTQWPNAQYNDTSSGLVAMTAARYANLWFYLEVDGGLHMVYGQAEYTTVAQADAENPPSLVPDKVSVHSWLIGRILFQKSDATATQLESVYTSNLSLTGASDHTNLSNLAWTSSGHTGTVSTIAGFSGAGAAAEYAIGTDIQAYDATLTSIAALGTAADKMLYTTGIDTWAEASLTTFARSILDDDSEATFKATVNLEIGVDVQAYDAGLADIAGLAVTDGNFIVGNGANWVAENGSTARASLGVYSTTEVDNKLAGVAKRASVRVATTANITIATALNSGDSIDDVVLADGDLVLVKSQTAQEENGVYVVDASPYRSTEFDTYNEIAGSLIAVNEGTVNADSLWLCTSNAGGTLETTAIAFSQMQVSGELIATNNLSDLANASTARTNLGVAIGTNVQAWDADLTTIAGLSSADSNFIVGSATGWVVESGATARASLGSAASGANSDITSLSALSQMNANVGVGIAGVGSYTFYIQPGTAPGNNASLLLQTPATGADDVFIYLSVQGNQLYQIYADRANNLLKIGSTSAPQILLNNTSGLVYFTNASVGVNDILDEDTMVSNSATALATQQSIKAYVDAQTAGANTALSNLAAVAINTSLISDTDITDDLGSSAIRWRDIYAATLRTGDTATDTLLLQARDVDGASWTTFATLTAGNTPTMNLSSSVTIGVGNDNIATAGANSNITSLTACGLVDSGGVNPLQLTGTTEVVVNDASEDVDFRVESNTDANALFVDGANGVVTLASQPSARMTRITTAQSIPSGVTTKVQYNGESWDVGSNFDSTTNYRFTAPVAGKYFVTGAVMFADSLGVGDIVALGFYINGALHSQSRLIIGVAGTYQRLAHTDLVNLGANDYVEAFVTHSNAASRDLNPNPADTYLSIQKLS